MINLLPPKRLLDMRTARANTILRRYVNLLAIGVVAIFAALGSAYYFLESQQRDVKTVLAEEQKRVAILEPVQKEAESLSVTINTIASLFSRNIVFSDMLRNIGATMPSGAVLTGLQFSIETADAPFVISAEVENEERAAVLRNNLVSSGLFEAVEIKSITRNEEKQASQSTAPTTATDGQSAPESAPQQTSRYKFTTIINTKLKTAGVKK